MAVTGADRQPRYRMANTPLSEGGRDEADQDGIFADGWCIGTHCLRIEGSGELDRDSRERQRFGCYRP
jgi:hypothetical protein